MHVTTATAVLIMVVYTLAVMRITRLINADKIADGLRLYPATKARQATLMAYEAEAHDQDQSHDHNLKRAARWSGVLEFMQCPWCVGWWVALAGAIIPVLAIGWPWWAMFGVALAASHLVGVLARFADTEEISIEDADNAEHQ